MTLPVRMFAALAAISASLSLPAGAQQCDPAQFDAIIDATGEELRQFTARSQPTLHAKFERLARQRNEPTSTAVERGYAFVSDEQSQELDARARKLLIDFHAIGDAAATNPSCAELDRLRSVAQQLREVTAAKFAHMSLKVDQALKNRVASSRAAPAAPPEQRAPTPTNGTSRPPATAPRPSAPTAASANSWRSGTSVTLAPKPDVMRSLPPVTMPVDVTYSVEEISQAGRGFFGTVSAGLASVIQFAFENYGRPNGYILGTEGGGAFLAGLSYGEGRLVTKQFPEQQVYWQGPTIGYDVGATGSRVMVLVYNLNRADQIFTRFAGLGGSAFVVGGAGITYHQRGSLVLAPIRTGLGLRLGANIGYLKFTPRPTFNPF